MGSWVSSEILISILDSRCRMLDVDMSATEEVGGRGDSEDSGQVGLAVFGRSQSR